MSKHWYASATDEQKERHRESCRQRYFARKASDPELLARQWQQRKEKLEANGLYEAYKSKQCAIVKRAYARERHKVLAPDKEKREYVVKALGAKCVRCGYDADIRALVLDHKNGDGYLDRARIGSRIGRYYWTRLDEAKANLQVLCCNCNHLKAIDDGEHNRSRRLKD